MRRFSPAIVAALRGYRRGDFLADLGAGLTVGLIALPLAIGFGIASGVTPQQGLWTGIIASVVVALFEAGLAERIGLDRFCADIDHALAAARELLSDRNRT
jgi:sulfate permease, SulP family